MYEIDAEDFFHSSINQIIIDVRSPNEYKKAHLKGALNFYALSNIEHELVGTKYHSNSFQAKLMGASFICKNVSIHLKKIQRFINPYKNKIYIYCARGGQRSGAFGHILSEIGFEVIRCNQGFKSIRNYTINYLNSYTNKNFVTLAGNTACGKTRLLKILDNKIDLEGLAHHFGSTFGSRGFSQPSQQQFDLNLIYSLNNLDNNKKIFIEAESKNIGSITISNNFYEQINNGIKVLCVASLETRIANCVSDYKNIKKEFFSSCLTRLNKYLGNATCEKLMFCYDNKDYENIAKILLLEYYDKVYKPIKNYDFILNLDDLNKAKYILNNL